MVVTLLGQQYNVGTDRIRCSLVVDVDAGREGLRLRGDAYFRLPLYTRNGQVGEYVKRTKKKLRHPGHMAPRGLFLQVGGLTTQRF